MSQIIRLFVSDIQGLLHAICYVIQPKKSHASILFHGLVRTKDTGSVYGAGIINDIRVFVERVCDKSTRVASFLTKRSVIA